MKPTAGIVSITEYKLATCFSARFFSNLTSAISSPAVAEPVDRRLGTQGLVGRVLGCGSDRLACPRSPVAGALSRDISVFSCGTVVRGFLAIFYMGYYYRDRRSSYPIHFPIHFEPKFLAPTALFRPKFSYCRKPILHTSPNAQLPVENLFLIGQSCYYCCNSFLN